MQQQTNYINPFNRQALQKAMIDALTKGKAEFNTAVTLTFPTRVESRKEAQERCAVFRDYYNKTFGYASNHLRAAKYDKTKSAPFFAILEGNGKQEHLHYHIALHRPKHVSHDRFNVIVQLLWYNALSEQYSRNTVEPIYSGGWAQYITKQISSGNTDVIDERNYNVY